MIKDFWAHSAKELVQLLNSDTNGLSRSEAEKRLRMAGQGEVRESPLWADIRLFIGQFTNPLMLLLIGAVLISLVVGEPGDIWMIIIVIISAGLLGFIQERNAGKTVQKLKSLLQVKSTVLRDGEVTIIDTSKIVTGDVMVLEAGDIITADCIVLESNELHVNEASLTGESFPVRKEPGICAPNAPLNERSNCLWEGTNVVSGNGKALVVHTGKDSLFGNIIRKANIKPETGFEKGVKDFGYFLLRITMILATAILVLTLLNGRHILEATLFSLALAVGMAPELLPAITTIAMSAGAGRLLKKKVIVKRLASIQNLGEISVLCTDKTGTITKGIITLEEAVDTENKNSDWVRYLGYLNAIHQSGYKNPIDDALIHEKPDDIQLIPEKTGEIPYDFIRKRLTIAVEDTGGQMLVCKGAFNEIAEICTRYREESECPEVDEKFLQKISAQYESYGARGYRVLGVCYKYIASGQEISKDLESEMIYAGLLIFNDPVKEDIIQTLSNMKALQVNIKIITGDNRNVALSVARKIGIPEPVLITGSELTETSSEALIQKVQEAHIFAEVEPFQKERIIRALRQSYVVAYMGDGINDVAALKASDIGISVDNAVDVAKEAADIVLTEKNLDVLAEGIMEGRKTFANTIKYIYISTGSTFGNMLSMAVISMVIPFLPMLPKQILLTNLISDFPYILIASDNVDESILKTAGKWNIRTINRYMLVFGAHSSVFDLITFATLYFVFMADEGSFQTGWFLVSVLTELIILFVIRTRESILKSTPMKGLFWISVASIVFTLVLPYLPFAGYLGFVRLPFKVFSVMCFIVVLYTITAEYLKHWFYRRYG